MTDFKKHIDDVARSFESERFKGIRRLYTPEQVVAQRGTIAHDYTVARENAEAFYQRLRELFEQRRQITTLGPYSPGQAVAMKRMGIEGIYLGGWATSAKGSLAEDPGADLASYPLSQVPDEAATIVRALLTADRNQAYNLSRLSPEQRASAPVIDYRPFLIADADTGHGGEAHVRNLIRRFVEVGVTGYHIEDQKPGVKKCGHQGGKVLVSQAEQNMRLNAARFQLDVMGVPGILVARTDAEAATLLESNSDERDQSRILGATYVHVPSYKTTVLALFRALRERGLGELNGDLLFGLSDTEMQRAFDWFARTRLDLEFDQAVTLVQQGKQSPDMALDQVSDRLLDAWQAAAGLKTYAEAVTEVMQFHVAEGANYAMSVAEWQDYAARSSLRDARDQARSLGIQVIWDGELARTPEGYYQIRGGIDYAIQKSLAAAPFADILWMETKTARLDDARQFADAIHAVYPDKMLAYNLSPSFNWDTTGMSEEEMRRYPDELGKLGFVFNFITYGGHQIDGLAAEEFATALQQDGMLALARLQRKFRLLDSPYKTPQTLVGGPRIDAALLASSGRVATTKAMGKGSTQYQHLIQTEVPTKVLEGWLGEWARHNGLGDGFKVKLLPHTAGSELLELSVLSTTGTKIANLIFASIQDRRGDHILSVRDQNTFDPTLRKKRLMTLVHLYLIHRYDAESVHYVSPTDDNQHQTESMKAQGLYADVSVEVGQIIVATVHVQHIAELLDRESGQLTKLIAKM